MSEDTNNKEILTDDTNKEYTDKIDELLAIEKKNNRMLRGFYKSLCIGLFFFVMLYYFTPLNTEGVTKSVVYSAVFALINCLLMNIEISEEFHPHSSIDNYIDFLSK